MALRLIGHLFASSIVFLAGCVGVVEGDGPDSRASGSGIPLEPPVGIGQRALACEPDHAPLRRLSHVEYRRTLVDLFEGITLPEIHVAPDERRLGFTNNFESLFPSTLLINQYFENATAIADVAAPLLVTRLACTHDTACFRRFVSEFGARAFRRPLEPGEVDIYVSAFASGPYAGDFGAAAEMVVVALLQSPDFIYRPELGGADRHLDPYEIASRLSYFIWGSMPDDALFAAARDGKLEGAGLESEVSRMLADTRARSGLLAATTEWIGLDALATRVKDPSFAFTPAVRAALRESLEMFLWERVFSAGGSLDALLTSKGAYVNATIGPIFGITNAGPEWAWREFPERSGLLTHPAILAIHGVGSHASPVQRGKFILTDLLCDPPSPPPPGAAMGDRPEAGNHGEVLTNREGYELQTESRSPCIFCHTRMNPFGFAFEQFDTSGAYRTLDQGRPIDSSGASSGFTLTESFSFTNATELTTQLSTSGRVRACIVDKWVRYATGGGALAYDPCVRNELEARAVQPGASLREIVIAIALHPKFSAAEVVQ